MKIIQVLPVGALEYKFINTGTATVDAVFSFNAKNFLKVEDGKNSINKIAKWFYFIRRGNKRKTF